MTHSNIIQHLIKSRIRSIQYRYRNCRHGYSYFDQLQTHTPTDKPISNTSTSKSQPISSTIPKGKENGRKILFQVTLTQLINYPSSKSETIDRRYRDKRVCKLFKRRPTNENVHWSRRMTAVRLSWR